MRGNQTRNFKVQSLSKLNTLDQSLVVTTYNKNNECDISRDKVCDNNDDNNCDNYYDNNCDKDCDKNDNWCYRLNVAMIVQRFVVNLCDWSLVWLYNISEEIMNGDW